MFILVPKSYQWAIAAALTWLVLCSPNAEAQTGTPEAQADSRVGDALVNIASMYRDQAEREKRPSKPELCGPGLYNSTDELCAQWKAADAADTAAFWAKLSGFLSLAGLVGVMGALALTWQSNKIARTSAERQIRAYLSIELGSLEHWAVGKLPYVSINIENGGQTPAYKMNYYGALFVDRDALNQDAESIIALKDSGPVPEHVLHIGQKYIGRIASWVPIGEEEFSDMMEGRKRLYALVVVNYTDTFGFARKTRFLASTGGEVFALADAKARAEGKARTIVGWVRSRTGNDAT